MKTFEELGLSAPITKAIEELGYENPMPVQEEVIPYLLGDNIDLIALAQTGTGKTAAFGLPILQKLSQSKSSKNPRALILCPTRELCLQISDDLKDYSKYLKDFNILPVYGGSSIETQIRTLRKGIDILVATPGRLIDLMERGEASLSNVHTVVLDEADEMLNMGFSESIETILKDVPKERHLLLFSATMPKQILDIASKYLKNHKEIVIGNKNVGNKNIKHIYYMLASKHRYLALKRIADYYPNIYGIVFCRTRKETQEIADALIKDGYNADSLHGELSQAQRDYVMQRFRIKNIQILVATDVAARGLDVDNLTHVIHYGLPDDIESYTHRSGRTARAGKKGLSIAIIHSREGRKLREIEAIIKSPIERAKLPSGVDICKKQLMNLADNIERVVIEEQSNIDDFMPDILRKLDWIEKDDLLRRLMSMEFERLIKYYENAEEIDEADEKGKLKQNSETKKDKRDRKVEEGMARLFINFGKADKMYPNKLIELINKTAGFRIKIGKIDLMQKFAFFEVDEYDADELIQSMNNYEIEGRRISVEYADSPKKGNKRSSSRKSNDKKETKSKNNKSRNSKGRKDDEKYFDRFSKKGRQRQK